MHTRDKLLKSLRQKLRKNYGIDPSGKEVGIRAVYSFELPVYPTSDGGVSKKPEIKSFGLDCKAGMGSASFVTGAFGFTAASLVVKELGGA